MVHQKTSLTVNRIWCILVSHNSYLDMWTLISQMSAPQQLRQCGARSSLGRVPHSNYINFGAHLTLTPDWTWHSLLPASYSPAGGMYFYSNTRLEHPTSSTHADPSPPYAFPHLRPDTPYSSSPVIQSLVDVLL